MGKPGIQLPPSDFETERLLFGYNKTILLVSAMNRSFTPFYVNIKLNHTEEIPFRIILSLMNFRMSQILP